MCVYSFIIMFLKSEMKSTPTHKRRSNLFSKLVQMVKTHTNQMYSSPIAQNASEVEPSHLVGLKGRRFEIVNVPLILLEDSVLFISWSPKSL